MTKGWLKKKQREIDATGPLYLSKYSWKHQKKAKIVIKHAPLYNALHMWQLEQDLEFGATWWRN